MKSRNEFVIAAIALAVAGLYAAEVAQGPERPVRVWLVLDTSPSNRVVWPELRGLARSLVGELAPGDSVWVVAATAKRPRVIAVNEHVRWDARNLGLLKAVDDLRPARFWQSDLGAALSVPLSVLFEEAHKGRDLVAVLTDGRLSDEQTRILLEAAQKLKDAGARVIVTGVDDSNRRLLLAAAGGNLAWVRIGSCSPAAWVAAARSSGPEQGGWAAVVSAPNAEGERGSQNEDTPAETAVEPAAEENDGLGGAKPEGAQGTGNSAHSTPPAGGEITINVWAADPARAGVHPRGLPEPTAEAPALPSVRRPREPDASTVQAWPSRNAPEDTVRDRVEAASTVRAPAPPSADEKTEGDHVVSPVEVGSPRSDAVFEPAAVLEPAGSEDLGEPLVDPLASPGNVSGQEPHLLEAAPDTDSVWTPPGDGPALDSRRPSRLRRWVWPAVAVFALFLVLGAAALGPDAVRVMRARAARKETARRQGERALELVAGVNGSECVLGPVDALRRFHVGSDTGNALRLPGKGVAERHLELTRAKSSWRLRNLSRSAVTANGINVAPRKRREIRIPALVELADGVSFRLFTRPVRKGPPAQPSLGRQLFGSETNEQRDQ